MPDLLPVCDKLRSQPHIFQPNMKNIDLNRLPEPLRQLVASQPPDDDFWESQENNGNCSVLSFHVAC